VRRKKPADLLQIFLQNRSVSIAKVCRQKQVIATFLYGALSDIMEASFIGISFSLEALSDIGRYRNRCPP